MNKGLLKIGLYLIIFTVTITSCSSINERGSISYEGLKDVSCYHIGVAVNPSLLLNDSIYQNVVLSEFNSLTAENAMKMPYLSVSKNEYRWKEADAFVNFASSHNLRIHGHTLIWHNSIPEWMKDYKTDREGWKMIMKEYIINVMSRWKGRITSWDVVNEAIGDDGRLKPGFWLDKIGPDFVKLAFQYAHEADPDALLFYNDYGHEYSTTRLKAINKMLSEMKKRGVPVHGTGLQMHTSLNRKPGDLRNAVIESAKTGLLVHVSELDIAINTEKDKNMIITDSLLQVQNNMFKEVAQAMKEIPEGQRYGITFWGVCDHDSFMYSDKYQEQPLLFDSIYTRKIVYKGFVQGCRK